MPDLIPAHIDDYARSHTTPLSPLLDELVRATHERMPEQAGMLSGAVEGRLLQMLAAMVGARRVLEVGTFTGFSSLMMAEALPDDGRVVTCELDPETAAFARSFHERSPHGHKIEVRVGHALDTIAGLEGPFDVIFVDADKEGYPQYYEAALPLLAKGGVMAFDNVLWSGRVLDPQAETDRAIVELNRRVQQDDRVTNVLLTVRDGVLLVRWR
jgi:caffeoyl-CoA O-methyltransferase